MRALGLLLSAVLLGGCSLIQPPTPAPSPGDQFSIVVYNRTEAPVFVLGHVLEACGSMRLPAGEALVAGATRPPGVAIADAVTMRTPRGYAGVVTVVVTAGGVTGASLGETPGSSLPACAGAA